MVDGYQFRINYQRALKAAGVRVLVVDDGGRCRDYSADLVLDQGLDSSEDQYRNREAYTRLMLGTRYVMLRREFGAWRSWKRATRPGICSTPSNNHRRERSGRVDIPGDRGNFQGSASWTLRPLCWWAAAIHA